VNKTAWYTFGNHFHWVDMQWLWGYGVLGASVRDMLDFTSATGAPGNLNFDGIGYEKLASEDPQALALLREAARDGRVEIVGASYGQPYGLFHHGESAIRQLAYGVRAVERVVGVRPRSFWEEEFYFFPQLPQMLRDAGYEYASLFFQWTWHTPHVPQESAPAVWWIGVDGSRILTLPKGPLNLHQWPEDFDALLNEELFETSPAPVVQQWLELYPSPDWMCRSELLVGGVKNLFDHPEVDFAVGTVATVLDGVREYAVDREYTMDDVFHGMSLGKNGDLGHRRSRQLEQALLAAEAMSVLAASGGRPYPHWDAYPGWELEEAWRELLAFQHHDNDECEGLCGHVGYAGLDRADALVAHVADRTARHLAARTPGKGPRDVAINPCGWEREVVHGGRAWTVPAFGTQVLSDHSASRRIAGVEHLEAEATLQLRRGDFEVVVDSVRGVVTAVGGLDCGPEGLGGLRWERDGQPEVFVAESVRRDGDDVLVERVAPGGDRVEVRISLAPEVDAVDLHVSGTLTNRPDGWAHAALMTLVEPAVDVATVFHDTPYAVTAVEGRGTYTRKYPTGEWMTSPQVCEEVSNPFTALQLIDLVDQGGGGLLWMHEGSQGFHRADVGAWNVISMRDPWDEEHFVATVDARFRAMPHGAHTHAERWRLAQEFTRPVRVETVTSNAPGAPVPPSIVTIEQAPSVVATALYRDTALAGRAVSDRVHVNDVADNPVLLRVVELVGHPAAPVIRVAGGMQRAWRTSTLGELLEELVVTDGTVTVPLQGRGITTVALDIAEARPVPRNLDAHRGVWAQAHRTTEDED
jgi:alpha-mannosidase